MDNIDGLHARLLKLASKSDWEAFDEIAQKNGAADLLLHPEKSAPVARTGKCECGAENPACMDACAFGAVGRDGSGGVEIDREKCVGCGACIDACALGRLAANRETLPVIEAVRRGSGPVYAMVAPAAAGQFPEAGIGGLKSVLKAVGFADMVEVALFADLLALKEAIAFARKIERGEDFVLASCCCPVWIALIRRENGAYLRHVPDSVSPMVACGRAIKKMHPGSTTVFIGPCLAKKAEARERDLAGAVDFVLTFQEMKDIFEAFGVDLSRLGGVGEQGASSRAGRVYARTAGVSEAVRENLRSLSSVARLDKAFRPEQADGTKGCRELLERLKAGSVKANYLEGMGCEGGCVGGPKTLRDSLSGREGVEKYGETAVCRTALDNPHALEVLEKLGFGSVEELAGESEVFTRRFKELAAAGRR